MNKGSLSGLKKTREKFGLSKAQLAEKSGLSKTYISMLEEGKKSPTLNTISRLADALNVPYETLIESNTPA